jgi:hypothetical protein
MLNDNTLSVIKARAILIASRTADTRGCGAPAFRGNPFGTEAIFEKGRTEKGTGYFPLI